MLTLIDCGADDQRVEPLVWPRIFRFYKAFRSFKHGQPEDVEKLRLEFFRLLDALARPTVAS